MIRKISQFIHQAYRNILILMLILLLFPASSYAVEIDVLEVHNFIQKPPADVRINGYGIILKSYPRPVNPGQLKSFKRIKGELLYQLKVKVDGNIYYRLVLGNFPNRRLAQQRFNQVKGIYKDAWIGKRLTVEKMLLTKKFTNFINQTEAPESVKVIKQSLTPKIVEVEIPVEKTKSSRPARTVRPDESKADKMLKQARNEFFEHNYDQTVSIANEVIKIGDRTQQQKALELIGVSRERQKSFDLAAALYLQFLEQYPDSKFKARIEARLEGLETMDLTPQEKISQPVETGQWDIRGALAQYYSDDILDRDTIDNESISNVFVTNVDVFARRKSKQSAMVLRFDGGLINDLVDKKSDSRVSQAIVSYANYDSGYQITGGRQSRTAIGVSGRFDGLVYKQLTDSGIEYSLYTGFTVDSGSDDADTDRPFLGGSISFEPVQGYDVGVYLNHQEVSGLTDRQAIGAEIQHRFDKGFVFGILDYDVFYSDLNNALLVSNYRWNDQLIFNFSLDFRNSPLLTTTNAIRGQSVNTIDELQNLYTDQQIYDLAEDRTSKSQNLNLGASYQIDSMRQLYMSLSYTSIDETVASGNVEATDEIDDTSISTDYSVRDFLFDDDFSTFGFRLSDSSSSESISLRVRSRFSGSGSFRYDPQVRIDFRTDKRSDNTRVIFNPSMRMTYQFSRSASFEASLGIEYSNFDLPELEEQTIYSIFVGYSYQF